MSAEDSRRVSQEIARESPRLKNFIRKRVADEADVEDILQDVFSELLEAYHLMQPIGQVSAWLFRVAQNRITDLFRKRKTEARAKLPESEDEEEMLGLDGLLPSPEAGPEAAYARSVLLEELETALEELPAEQREVFIAHELEGRNFKQLSAETGVGMNTLLGRKHYAVLHLRKRLQAIYEEFTIK